MYFYLDEQVIYKGKRGIVWDNSIKFGCYDIKLDDGSLLRGIYPEELISFTRTK